MVFCQAPPVLKNIETNIKKKEFNQQLRKNAELVIKYW